VALTGRLVTSSIILSVVTVPQTSPISKLGYHYVIIIFNYVKKIMKNNVIRGTLCQYYVACVNIVFHYFNHFFLHNGKQSQLCHYYYYYYSDYFTLSLCHFYTDYLLCLSRIEVSVSWSHALELYILRFRELQKCKGCTGNCVLRSE
jgi:hypothetical protein